MFLFYLAHQVLFIPPSPPHKFYPLASGLIEPWEWLLGHWRKRQAGWDVQCLYIPLGLQLDSVRTFPCKSEHLWGSYLLELWPFTQAHSKKTVLIWDSTATWSINVWKLKTQRSRKVGGMYWFLHSLSQLQQRRGSVPQMKSTM